MIIIIILYPEAGSLNFAGRPWEIQKRCEWLQSHPARGQSSWIGQGLGTNLHWLLYAGSLQIWIL